MSFEHMFSPGGESPENFRADQAERSKDAQTEQGERFGWNDIIIPDVELKLIEEKLAELGVTSFHQPLSQGEVLNEEGTAWRPGEFVLSLSDQITGKPLEHEKVLDIVALLRDNPEQITIRLARMS